MGLASTEHADFVEKLRSNRRRRIDVAEHEPTVEHGIALSHLMHDEAHPDISSLPSDVAQALRAGARLDQPTFHQLYGAMPPDFRAELVEGIVVVPSDPDDAHSNLRSLLMGWLSTYGAATRGVTVLDKTTVLLPPDSELEIDGLAIEPSRGGQTCLDDGLVKGAPELVLSVPVSGGTHDFHGKFHAYQKAGVQEYVVGLLKERVVLWFKTEKGQFSAIEAGDDGIFRSQTFPGLWLDPEAIWASDGAKFSEAIERGLTSRERRQFVRKLLSERFQFSTGTLLFVISLLAILLAMVPYCRWWSLGQFSLANGRSIAIYAPGALEYAGPIYCDIKEYANVAVSGYCFMNVRPQRVPEGHFEVASTDSGDLAAIVLDNNIEFLYDFVSGEHWSSHEADVNYWSRNFQNVAFAQNALKKLDIESRGFHCSKLDALLDLQTHMKTHGLKPAVPTKPRSAASSTP